MAKEIKTKINKWDYIKPKSSCTTKESVNKTKSPPTDWEKIFASSDTSDRRLILNIYKECIKFNIRKTNQPIQK